MADPQRGPKVDAYMPLWIGDYLADTMTLEYPEHGAYLLLLMAHWRTGPLPEASLCTIVGCDPRTWRNKLADKLAPFFRVENGYWFHDRVIEEHAKALANKEKFADRAKRAAERRWSSSDASSMRQALLKECPSPSPSPVVANATTTSYPSIDGCTRTAAPPGDAPPDLLGDPPTPIAAPKRLNCPAEKIVAIYHETLPQGRRCMVLTEARRSQIAARWRHYAIEKRWRTEDEGLEFFRSYFAFVARSKFLTGQITGRNGRPFEVGIDWLMKAENWAKTVEGKYHG